MFRAVLCGVVLCVAGLRECEHPYNMLAEIGSMNMLENGGKQILPVIPQLIIPLKNALNTRDPEVMTRVMHIIQKLVDADELIGQVPMLVACVIGERSVATRWNVFAHTLPAFAVSSAVRAKCSYLPCDSVSCMCDCARSVALQNTPNTLAGLGTLLPPAVAGHEHFPQSEQEPR